MVFAFQLVAVRYSVGTRNVIWISQFTVSATFQIAIIT
jgi:hypothetical protein